MDVLFFWVTLGFLVEAARAVVKKCCTGRRQKVGNPLEKPLLNPQAVLDELDNCKLICCAHRWETQDSQEEIEEEYFQETSEDESLGVPDKLGVSTDDSDEEIAKLVGVFKIVKWESLRDNVTVSRVGDRRRSLKGKEIVEEQEEEIRASDLHISDVIRSRICNSHGMNSTKIYPEPLVPQLTSMKSPSCQLIHSRNGSDDYGPDILDQSAWDHNSVAAVEVRDVHTGESSQS